MKKVTIAKIRKRWKQKYMVPARYSTQTCYRVWVDNVLVYDGVDVFKRLMNKKETTDWVKKKYGNDVEIEYKDYGSINVS